MKVFTETLCLAGFSLWWWFWLTASDPVRQRCPHITFRSTIQPVTERDLKIKQIYCNSWGRKDSDTTERLIWSDLIWCRHRASLVAQLVKNLPANAGDARDSHLIPGSGRSPGEENGNPLQYSCLENPMGRGAWWATVHGVARVGHNWASKSSPPPLCDVLETWRVLPRVLKKFNWKLINKNIKGKEGYFLWKERLVLI